MKSSYSKEHPSKVKHQNIILLALFVLIIIVPLLLNPAAEYGGSDGNAEVAITELSPTYEPWFTPVWEPPSGEIESLMFTLLAVIGSSTIAYYLGYVKGKSK